MDSQRFQQAIALRDAGKAEQALKELRAMVALTPDPEEKATLLFSEGTCHQILGNLVEVRRCLEQAKQIAPKTEIWLYLYFQEADLLWNEGKLDEGHKLLEGFWKEYAGPLRTTQHRELYEKVQIRRGVMLTWFRHAEKAKPILEEALSFEIDDIERGDLYCNLGFCYYKLKKMEEAKRYLLAGIAYGQQTRFTIEAHYFLGAIYFRERAYAHALQEFEQVESQAQEAGIRAEKIYGWLALTCRALGKMPEAERYEKLAKAT